MSRVQIPSPTPTGFEPVSVSSQVVLLNTGMNGPLFKILRLPQESAFHGFSIPASCSSLFGFGSGVIPDYLLVARFPECSSDRGKHRGFLVLPNRTRDAR